MCGFIHSSVIMNLVCPLIHQHLLNIYCEMSSIPHIIEITKIPYNYIALYIFTFLSYLTLLRSSCP